MSRHYNLVKLALVTMTPFFYFFLDNPTCLDQIRWNRIELQLRWTLSDSFGYEVAYTMNIWVLWIQLYLSSNQRTITNDQEIRIHLIWKAKNFQLILVSTAKTFNNSEFSLAPIINGYLGSERKPHVHRIGMYNLFFLVST